MISWFVFFNDTATTEIYTLSLHDALPISVVLLDEGAQRRDLCRVRQGVVGDEDAAGPQHPGRVRPPPRVLSAFRVEEQQVRSEEHTSELQSRQYLVCRLLLEKKKQIQYPL